METQVGCVDETTQDEVSKMSDKVVKCHPVGRQICRSSSLFIVTFEQERGRINKKPSARSLNSVKLFRAMHHMQRAHINQQGAALH